MVAAQDTVIGATKGIASVVSSTPQAVIGESQCFAIIHFEDCKLQTARMHLRNQNWSQRFYFDVNSGKHFRAPQKAIAMGSKSTHEYFPPIDISAKPNLLMFIMRGIEGHEKIVSQKCLKVHDLLRHKDDLNLSSANEVEIDMELKSTIGNLCVIF